MDSSSQRPPWWFICVLVLSVLPLAAWPAMVSALSDSLSADSPLHALVLAFPVYAVGSVYCSYRCFDGQAYLSWILLLLLFVGYGSLLLLV